MAFSLIDPPKRGFNGRPLVALLAAVGMGILASYVAMWWRLDGQTVSWVFGAILWVAALLWYRLETPR